jgi:LAGLIDADG DNA endonuclease family
MNNSIIIGCILGDVYLNKYGTLTLEHSIEQSDYIYWKYEKLKELNFLTETSEPKLVTRIHPKTKKETKSLRFNTKSLFKQERSLFYHDGIKVIPSKFETICTCPLTCLAFLFMDDGGRGGNTPLGLVLDLSAYSLEKMGSDGFILFIKQIWNKYINT